MNKYLLAFLAAGALVGPAAALAQDFPSYAQPEDAQIRGRIVAFDGGYDLRVRDERGFIDVVELHPGTIIYPVGLTLAPGMIVSILGYNAGPYFDANEVDTPYAFYSGVPYFVGHPWYYYGPSVSIGFFFGGHEDWWHGRDFDRGYHYHGGVRYWHDDRAEHIYRNQGGEFHGREFVAPHEHGGYYHGNGNWHERGNWHEHGGDRHGGDQHDGDRHDGDRHGDDQGHERGQHGESHQVR
jgi:hypothetical protein